MKSYALLTCAILLFATTACNANNKNIVGNDLDAYGCKPSAGYSWSIAKQKCIRPFEDGIRMIAADNPNATSSIFLVFSDDNLQAELFMPNEANIVLDQRHLPNNTYAWNLEDDDTKNVRLQNDTWIIEQRGNIVYTQEKIPTQEPTTEPAVTPDIIEALFQGTDGRTKRLYHVNATFFTTEEKAIVTFDEKEYTLIQYVTGSGYGYKNDEVDLRGKGKEATLTFKDGFKLILNQQ